MVRFFNPRTDRWGEHFQEQAGELAGLTEIGEVTARLLEFNHPERLAHRRTLAETGRYLTIEALALLRDQLPGSFCSDMGMGMGPTRKPK